MNSTSEDTNTDVRVETLYTNAYVAVGQLADAIGPDTYRHHKVDEAKKQLRTGLEKTPDETDADAVDRVESALERLSDLGPLPLGERRMRVRDALADLAPVGAGLSDPGRLERAEGDGADVITSRPEPNARGPAPAEDRPTVPVFYSIPQRAADRAIERFNQRSEQVTAPETECLTDYVLDEIEQQLVVRVGGEPLAEYAAGQLEDVTTEAGDE